MCKQSAVEPQGLSIKHRRLLPSRCQKRQSGAVAIEFAALFVLFFTIAYSVIAYSLPITLLFSYKHLSAEAARQALRVDPAQDWVQYLTAVSNEVNRVVSDSWLPSNWYDGDCLAPESDLNWQPLTPVDGEPSFGFLGTDQLTNGVVNRVLYVCIQRKYADSGSERERAIIPNIKLGSIRLPPLPQENGEAILRGISYGRL